MHVLFPEHRQRTSDPDQRREYSHYLARQMGPMIHALMLMATLAYGVAVIASMLIRSSPVPLLLRLALLLPLLLVAMTARHVRRPRALSGLALLCVLAGLPPAWIVDAMGPIDSLLTGVSLPSQARASWLVLAPVAPVTAAYAAPFAVALLVLAMLAVRVALRLTGNMNEVRRAPPWDCGFGPLTARMQYTAHSFAMPLRRIFRPIWELEESVEEAPGTVRYTLQIHDRFWKLIFEPVNRTLQRSIHAVRLLQSGSVRTYLTVSFVTLLVLLWVIS